MALKTAVTLVRTMTTVDGNNDGDSYEVSTLELYFISALSVRLAKHVMLAPEQAIAVLREGLSVARDQLQ